MDNLPEAEKCAVRNDGDLIQNGVSSNASVASETDVLRDRLRGRILSRHLSDDGSDGEHSTSADGCLSNPDSADIDVGE